MGGAKKVEELRKLLAAKEAATLVAEKRQKKKNV